MNIASSDPKAAAAIRDAEGLKPLVAFLTSANEALQIASATALLGCSTNETNKSVLRELGAIDLLLKMLAFTNPRDAQAAAVATLAHLTLNEDESRVLLRLQGGLKKLQALLYANDPLLQAHAAQVFAHCAPNRDSRIAMRLADCLAPLVALLSSPHAAARLAAAGALMQATQATRTNQVKCRELGAIAPLLRLLEPPEEGPPDREVQRRGVWTLSNIACEQTAAKQLRQSPSGFGPLILLIAGGDPVLQVNTPPREGGPGCARGGAGCAAPVVHSPRSPSQPSPTALPHSPPSQPSLTALPHSSRTSVPAPDLTPPHAPAPAVCSALRALRRSARRPLASSTPPPTTSGRPSPSRRPTATLPSLTPSSTPPTISTTRSSPRRPGCCSIARR